MTRIRGSCRFSSRDVRLFVLFLIAVWVGAPGYFGGLETLLFTSTATKSPVKVDKQVEEDVKTSKDAWVVLVHAPIRNCRMPLCKVVGSELGPTLLGPAFAAVSSSLAILRTPMDVWSEFAAALQSQKDANQGAPNPPELAPPRAGPPLACLLQEGANLCGLVPSRPYKGEAVRISVCVCVCCCSSWISCATECGKKSQTAWTLTSSGSSWRGKCHDENSLAQWAVIKCYALGSLAATSPHTVCKNSLGSLKTCSDRGSRSVLRARYICQKAL